MLWIASFARAPAHAIVGQAPSRRWSQSGPPITAPGPCSLAPFAHSGHRRSHRPIRAQARSFSAGRGVEAGGSVQPRQRTYDVVSLGNLCVDIVLPVASLPPADHESRLALFRELTAAPPPESSWEVGASCNFMIAASRLGLRVGCAGHCGDDVYGDFLRKILADERVGDIEPLVEPGTPLPEAMRSTLLCFVLVGLAQQHAFCSRYDFGPWPLLEGVTALPERVAAMLADTHALLLNGCVFDELPAALVAATARQARAGGAAVFFDPGPRSWALARDQRDGLDAMLDATDVLLVTQDEAAAISGHDDPEAAARWALDRPDAATRWCLVKLGAAGALLVTRDGDSPLRHNSLKVPVKDTVGCGDSCAAAIVLGYTRGHDTAPVLALANAVGAATAMGTGAGRNVASPSLVMELLRREVNSKAEGISAWGAGRTSTDHSTPAPNGTRPGSAAQFDGDGRSPAKQTGGGDQPVVVMGPGVAAGDAMSLATAAAEVAASREAMHVLQMSLDDSDS